MTIKNISRTQKKSTKGTMICLNVIIGLISVPEGKHIISKAQLKTKEGRLRRQRFRPIEIC